MKKVFYISIFCENWQYDYLISEYEFDICNENPSLIMILGIKYYIFDRCNSDQDFDIEYFKGLNYRLGMEYVQDQT